MRRKVDAGDKIAAIEWSAKKLPKIASSPDRALMRYFFSAAASEIQCSGRIPLVPPQHFVQLDTVDPEPFLDEIRKVDAELWNGNKRHDIRVHSETRAINLAVPAAQRIKPRHCQYVELCESTQQFPLLMRWLENFAATTGNGILQLIRIVKLAPHSQVYPHVDRGLYYLIRDRYHLVLASPSGSRMQCEDQTSIWHAGEVWWFNNHVVHQAFNDGDAERIHVIFDVLPYKNKGMLDYIQKYGETLGAPGASNISIAPHSFMA